MKYQDQANNNNNNNNLNDPTVSIDPQALVEFDDLPISGEHEERVKGGLASPVFFKPCTAGAHYDQAVNGGVKVAS